MGKHVAGGERVRWRKDENRWVLMARGHPFGVITEETGGASLRLVPHPALPAVPFTHWFESVLRAKLVMLALADRGIKEAKKNGRW